MQLKIYQVDAFAERTFQGNPAAVCPLQKWLPRETMQLIALENNLSETAFFVPTEEGFHIRWFTPTIEVDLCGHATLATAHVLFQHLAYDKEVIVFTCSSGPLTVARNGQGYTLDFPTDLIDQQKVTPLMEKTLGTSPLEAWRGKDDLLLILPTEKDIVELTPNFFKMQEIPTRGVIVSAPGEEFDFVSRCFFPNAGINEDPVTGSAHTTLIPYWSKRLGKQTLQAKQLSARGGLLHCQMLQDRVKISGNCVTYLIGSIAIAP